MYKFVEKKEQDLYKPKDIMTRFSEYALYIYIYIYIFFFFYYVSTHIICNIRSNNKLWHCMQVYNSLIVPSCLEYLIVSI